MASSLDWARAAAVLNLPLATGWPAMLAPMQCAALQAGFATDTERREARLIGAVLTAACSAKQIACETTERTVQSHAHRIVERSSGGAPVRMRLPEPPTERIVLAYRIAAPAFVAWLRTQDEEPAALVAAWAQATKPAPAPDAAIVRQDERLRMCEAAGLVMPDSPEGRLPAGVGAMAEREGRTRQAFSQDLRAALRRRAAARRAGVHRIE